MAYSMTISFGSGVTLFGGVAVDVPFVCVSDVEELRCDDDNEDFGVLRAMSTSLLNIFFDGDAVSLIFFDIRSESFSLSIWAAVLFKLSSCLLLYKWVSLQLMFFASSILGDATNDAAAVMCSSANHFST